MKKIMLVFLSLLLLMTVTACSSRQNSGDAGNNGNAANIGKFGNNDNHSSLSNGFKIKDSSFDLNTLISNLKNAGCIDGEPETMSVGESGAEKVVAFGNLVILEYDPDKSNAIIDVEAAGEVKLDGKTHKNAGQVGPYVLIFLDGNVDEKAVDAFYLVVPVF